MAGVISIIQITKKHSDNIYSLIMLFIILSISTAFMNLLPIPGLDGGSALISIIEMITRRKISHKVFTIISYIGISFILTLLVFTIINDMSKISFLKRLFNI